MNTWLSSHHWGEKNKDHVSDDDDDAIDNAKGLDNWKINMFLYALELTNV